MSLLPKSEGLPETNSISVPWLGLLVGVTLILFFVLQLLFFVLQLDRAVQPNFGSQVEGLGVLGDVNITFEHTQLASNQSVIFTQLASNQSVILHELRLLNLYSQCVVDPGSIRSGELPIDDQGGFQRVSILTLVCPEIEGIGE